MDENRITYRIEVEEEHIPVRGNAQASGDDEADKEVEDEILARLEQGDVWAWAAVTVVAEVEGFEGRDHLGGCSYKDEADFKSGPYYEDMCAQAREDLLRQIEETKARIARTEAT